MSARRLLGRPDREGDEQGAGDREHGDGLCVHEGLLNYVQTISYTLNLRIVRQTFAGLAS